MSQTIERPPRLVLPTEPTPATKAYRSQKILHVGPAGCGKSEFWAQGNHLFVDMEGNVGHLTIKRVPCRSWGELGDIYTSLVELAARRDVEFPYEGVVLDTGDRLVMHATEEVIQQVRERYPKHADEIHTLPDIGDGKAGWYELAKLINLFLSKFELLPCAKIVICHEKDFLVELPTKAKFTRYGINIGGQTGGAFIAWANHILHMRPQGGGDIIGAGTPLVMRTLPVIDIEAKSHGAVVPDGMMWKVAEDGKRLAAAANWQAFRQLFD